MSDSGRPAAARDRAVVLALFGAVLVVGVATLSPWPLGVFYDDGIYAVLARSLATGHGYRYLNLPGEPPATHYPPGYPLFLALLSRLTPASPIPADALLLKYANAALRALAAVGAFALARTRLGLGTFPAAAAVLAASTSIQLLVYTNALFSEPLFLALLMPALLLAEHAAGARGRTRHAAVAGLAVGVVTLVRTLGVAAVPVLFGVLAVRRGRAAALTFAASFAAVVLPWQVWARVHAGEVSGYLAGSYGSYTGWLAAGYHEGGLGFALRVVLRNLGDAALWLSGFVCPEPLALGVVLAVAVAAAFVIGLAALGRGAPATAGFVVVYVTIVLTWPFTPGRFLVGVLPLLAVVAARGLEVLWRARPAGHGARFGRLVGIAALALAALAYAANNLAGYRARAFEADQRAFAETMAPVVRWVRANTASGDVVATGHDALVYLYTGRQAVPPRGFTAREYLDALPPRPPEELLARLNDVRARWLVVVGPGDPEAEAAAALAAREPPRLVVAGELPGGGAVFAVR